MRRRVTRRLIWIQTVCIGSTSKLRPVIDMLLFFIWCVLFDIVHADSWNFAGVNVALGKNTAQSPGTWNRRTSDLAVDGNTNQNMDAGSCSHTYSYGRMNTTAAWTVYLNGSYTLKGIRIFNRDSFRFRLKKFTIIGFPTTTILHNDSTANPQLYNDLLISISIESAKLFSSVTIEVPAITYTSSFVTLCEVQIYSENHDCPIPSSDGHLVATVWEGTGFLNASKGLVSTGTTLEFSCGDEFMLMGNQSATCLPNQTYDATVPTCIDKHCRNPSNVLNGYYVPPVHSKYSVGKTITWECLQGYGTEQKRTRQCLTSLSWSGGQPVCTRITCAYPSQFENGILAFENNEEYVNGSVGSGTAIKVACAEGFKYNDSDIRCNLDGQWDTKPVCRQVECNRLDTLNGGHYVYMLNGQLEKSDKDVYAYGVIASAVCNGTFFKASNKYEANRAREHDGNWTGHTDLCVLHGCSSFNGSRRLLWTLRNGTGYSSSIHGVVSPGTVLDFQCEAGYILVGADVIVCLKDGNYSSGVPHCMVLHSCPSFNGSKSLQWTLRIGTGYSSSIHGVVSPGTVLDFQCEAGYILVGADVIVCLKDGNYSSRVPHCMEMKVDDQRASSQPTSLPTASVMGGVLGGFVLGVAAGIALLCLIRKRKQQPKESTPPTTYSQSDNPAFDTVIESEHVYSELTRHE